MATKWFDDAEDFAGRDRKRNKASAKELRKQARAEKAQVQSQWQDEAVE